LLLRGLPEPSEDLDLQRQHLDRAINGVVGRRPVPEGTDLPLILQGIDRELVELPDGLGVLEAVREHLLAVHDRVGTGQAREDGPLGHLKQELVAGRHRVPERLELQVLGQHGVVSRHRRDRAGVPLALKVPPYVGDREQVAARHSVENRVAQSRLHGEVLVFVQQEDLHEPILSIMRWYVRPYLPAIAAA